MVAAGLCIDLDGVISPDLTTLCGLFGRIPLPKKTHKRFQHRLTARDSSLASTRSDVSIRPPCFEIFVMEGHISTIFQFPSSFLCPTYQCDPGVPFTKNWPDVTKRPPFSLSPKNDVTKGHTPCISVFLCMCVLCIFCVYMCVVCVCICVNGRRSLRRATSGETLVE